MTREQIDKEYRKALAEVMEIQPKVGALLVGKTSFTIMMVMADLFAKWMTLHREEDHCSMVMQFHDVAMERYCQLTGDGESLH